VLTGEQGTYETREDTDFNLMGSRPSDLDYFVDRVITDYDNRSYTVFYVLVGVFFITLHWFILWMRGLFEQSASDIHDYNPYSWMFALMIGGDIAVFTIIFLLLVSIEKSGLQNFFQLIYQPFRGITIAIQLLSKHESILRLGFTFDWWFLVAFFCTLLIICSAIVLNQILKPYLKKKLIKFSNFRKSYAVFKSPVPV
jgi:hypothetical protein